VASHCLVDFKKLAGLGAVLLAVCMKVLHIAPVTTPNNLGEFSAALSSMIKMHFLLIINLLRKTLSESEMSQLHLGCRLHLVMDGPREDRRL
jgi:hypothetical protein